MYLLGIDFETTGFEAGSDVVTEVGAVLWDMDKRAPALFHSELVCNGRDQSAEAQAVTGIEEPWLKNMGVAPNLALGNLVNLIAHADYVVAHNAEFEMRFLGAWLRQNGYPLESGVYQKPWIDTLLHVPYPQKISVRDLVSLCAHHGFVNPHPHRALWDAWAMMKILDLYHPQFGEIQENVNAQRVKVWSKGITFNTKDKPKALGYRWDGDSKRWWLAVKESEVDNAINEAKAKGFETETETIPVYSTLEGFEKIR